MRRGRYHVAYWSAFSLILFAEVAFSSDGKHSLAVQGGWWSIEAEYRAPFGLFIDAGVPWFALVLDGTTGGTDWNFAVGGKLGYEVSLLEELSLRFGVRDAQSISHGCPCWNGQAEKNVKTLVSIEAGLRYEYSVGLLFGLDLSVYAFLVDESGHGEIFWPGYSLLFSQAYIGYRWSL